MDRQKQKNKNSVFKIVLLIVVITLLTGFIGVYAFSEYGQKEYADNVLRLHVLANSNTSEDQALKLKVRDEVGITVSKLTEGANSAAETEAIVKAHLDEIRCAAEERIQKEGYSYPVEVVTGNFYFPTKYYAKGALPAGNYEAVRVIIGEGKGENWWCVLFPPLCFSNGQAEPGLNESTQNQGEKEEVTLKFKIVEVFQEAKHSLSRMWQKIFK